MFTFKIQDIIVGHERCLDVGKEESEIMLLMVEDIIVRVRVKSKSCENAAATVMEPHSLPRPLRQLRVVDDRV